jgi:hypothetical protein
MKMSASAVRVDRAVLADFLRIHDPALLVNIEDILLTLQDWGAVASFETRYGAVGGLTAPELDARSRFFDPLKALYSPTTLPPVAGAMPAKCLHRVPAPAQTSKG